MQIPLDKNQIYIILRGVFRIERYREPDAALDDILESSEELDEMTTNKEPESGVFGNSEFGMKFKSLMRKSLLTKL